MTILIIGGGPLCFFLARHFVERGLEVTVVESDESVAEQLHQRLGCHVVVGDGTDPEVQREAEAEAADIALVLTRHDHDNLVACQVARHLHGVPRVCAVINDPDHEEVFRELGVDVTVSAVRIVGDLFEKEALQARTRALLGERAEQVAIEEHVVVEDCAAVGRTLAALGLPRQTVVAAVVRGAQVLIPRGDSILEPDDRVLVVARPEARATVAELFETA